MADEQILEHARLRVRAVEDGDVARRSSRPRCSRADARRDDARLVVLVLGLDHADGLAVAELAPERFSMRPALCSITALAASRMRCEER